MSPDRWNELKRIFDAVVDLPPTGQVSALDAACRDDLELRHELEKMLAADASTALDTSPLAQFARETEAYGADQKIGRYRILHEVGRGGMGAVFAAVRDDGEFEQKVAVKVIKSGLNTQAIVRRFRRERQILASLEHPHIARLLDGGMTEEGLPFYVMEFVEGVPIDEYCRGAGLGVTARLELFRQVCAAVSYAHIRLIVHRDLKPSNILVTAGGQVKLLDFGISEVLSREADDGGRQTVTQLGLMTPDYASPEQFRGEPATTATDVYSLGVVLFQLLTGRLPHDLTGLRLDQMLKRVCEAEPPRPSTVGARPHASSSAPIAAAQGDARLRGDLDNIILKALRKEPEHRYASVEQFSEDLARHLKGLPVAARPATFGYKAEKFIKRNRVAVALSALVLLTLVGGIAATVWQAVRAERERKLAQKRFEQARDLANSLVFKYHDAIANLPNSSPVRELLLKDASAYLDDLAQDAGGDPALLREVALAYAKLGDIQGKPHSASVGNTAGAIEHYEKAAALFETVARNSPASQRLRANQDLLSIYKSLSTALARAGEGADRREELLNKRLSIIDTLLAEQPDNFALRIESAHTHLSVGKRRFESGFDEGLRYYNEHVLPVLFEAGRLAPEADETLGLAQRVYSDLGWYLGEEGRLQAELGEPHEISAGYFQRSLDYYRRVAEIYEKQFRANPEDLSHKRGHAIGIVNIGIALRDTGRVEEALEHLERGRELYQELAKFDPNNLQAVFDLGDLYTARALCHVKKREYARAVADLETSLEHMDRVIAADAKHQEAISYRVDVLLLLGNTYAEAGRLSVALGYYEQAGNYGRKTSTEAARASVQLGRVHLNAGRAYAAFAGKQSSTAAARELWGKAQAELQKAAEILERARTPESAVQLRVVNYQLRKCASASG
ncbi:MAG TPA: protein kinase [Pyrinomonadaceae bacterium]|nr:protein kinase [Pyrinomonadaceae bacterium]